MRRVWIIFDKEVIDNLRDRRALTSSIITPLFTPLIMIALIVVLGKTLLQDPQDVALHLPVSGAEFAPSLIAFLEQNNVIVEPAPSDPRTAVREGNLDVVLVIDAKFGQKLQAGAAAPVQMIADSSRQSAINSIQRTRSLLDQYSRTIGVLRLIARGIDPMILYPVAIQSVDVSTPQSQTLIFLSMMPFLIIMTIFVGGMYVVIDTTAGERERGSLEPLLTNPVTRWEIAVGKLLASLPFALTTLVLSLLVFWVAFNLFPLEELSGLPLKLDFSSLLAIFWLALPMVLLASALQILVATFTRSFKEAQTYLSFLPLAAGLPSMFLAFLPVKLSLPVLMIPTFGQSLLINKIMRQETVLPSQILVTSLATVLVSCLLIWLAIKFFEREQILQGR